MKDIFDVIYECKNNGKDFVTVTVTEKSGMGPADVGKKMIVTEDEDAFGTVGGGAIEFYAREKAKTVLKERKSFTEKYILNDRDVYVEEDAVKLNMACGGKVTLFYEFNGPKQRVYIFGAGHCGAALAKVLKPLGFYISIIDERENVIKALDKESYDKVYISGFADFIENNGLRDNTFIVVCTPSHTNDYHVLNKILEKKYHPSYFGMLCSRKKINDYLEKAYETYGKDINLDNFYSPIGLNIGGNSPEEIAISISAEMLSVLYHKNEFHQHLRDKEAKK